MRRILKQFFIIIFSIIIISIIALSYLYFKHDIFAKIEKLQNGEKCVIYTNNQDRVICFDKAFGVKKKTIHAEMEDQKRWLVVEDTSQLDGVKSVALMLISDESLAKSFNPRDYQTISMRCTGDTTTVLFSAGDHFLSNIEGYDNVTYQLNDETPRTIETRVASDNRSLGLWSTKLAIPFIKQLFGYDKIIVRLTPFNEKEITMEFNISSLEERIEPVRELCNW